MSDMGEHAIAIARVSPGKDRREEDQIPGLKEFASRQGYILDDDHIIQIHAKSAFHGKHLKYIRAAIVKHVKNGDASVVIFRDVDRSSRQGAQATFDLRGEIIRAGGRMEFAGQEYLNDQRNQEMMLGILATAAKEESETKARRKLQGNGVKRAKGEMIGRPPWGYDPIDAFGKVVVKVDGVPSGIIVNIKPNSLGRKWVPKIFEAAINGKSLTAICRMLDGVPSPMGNGLWDDATIRRLINRKTYSGSMRGNPNMKFDALVSVERWKEANAAVASRFKRGREASTLPPSFVRPLCGACYGTIRDGAPSGKSPMYRTTKSGHAYYNCKGHGPGRKSCGGPGIPVTDLDAAIDQTMAHNPNQHMTRKFVAGDNQAEKLAEINEKIAAAAVAGDYILIQTLGQEAAQIEPSKRKGRMILVDSGLTVGQHWQTLDLDGKRDELTGWIVVAGLETNKAVSDAVKKLEADQTAAIGVHDGVVVVLLKSRE